MSGGPRSSADPDALAAVLSMLRLDGLAVETIRDLEEADVPVLLYKGVVTQSWLYDRDTARTYSDVDLLVPPASVSRAREVMRRRGMGEHHAGVLGLFRPLHEEAWTAPAGVVDLHWGIDGVTSREWPAAWEALYAEREELLVAGTTVSTPGLIGRSLLAAMAAAYSRPDEKACSDLGRAAGAVSTDTWSRVLSLAASTGCHDVVVAGLGRRAEGRTVLDVLGLGGAETFLSSLHKHGASYRVLIWARRPGLALGEKAALVARCLSLSRPDLGVVQRARIRLAGVMQALLGLTGYAAARVRWWFDDIAGGPVRVGRRYDRR